MEKTVVKPKPEAKDEPEASIIPCLVVLEGRHVGEVFRITEPSLLIGRDDHCDMLIHEEGVSRKHARLDCMNGTYTLTDLESTNGTFINGEAIGQKSLRNGDKIRLGDVLLRFAIQDETDVSYQERMRTLAMKDGLTKIYNRRAFLEMLNREVNYALRLRQPLTCLMIDIDSFKETNDQHGHQAGDEVLIQVAQRIGRELRIYDGFARYGGEEFVVLLRATALENAKILAERLRRIIEDMNIQVGDASISVTISVGVSVLDPDHPVSADDLIKQADRCLYEAKEGGRNRVVFVR